MVIVTGAGCGQRRLQGRCVQGAVCTEYYGKTKAELDSARGVCRLLTGDSGWFEDGSSCPDDGLVGTCRVDGDGDHELRHDYGHGYTLDEAQTDRSDRGGTFEPPDG